MTSDIPNLLGAITIGHTEILVNLRSTSFLGCPIVIAYCSTIIFRDTRPVLTSTISPTPVSSDFLQTVPQSVSRSTWALGKPSSCGIESFYTNTCVTKCSLIGLQQLAWSSCVCVCGTQIVRISFAKAGFIMPGEELMSTEATPEKFMDR